jgi:pimeloyl-ACP methyl ester carboxylesterase
MGVAEGEVAKPRVTIRTGEVVGGGLHFGYREAGAGTVCLCIGGGESFSPMRELLAERYRVIELQLPDALFPASPATASAIREAVATLGVDRFDLLAHGAGAGLALSLALEHSTDVRALVLLGPSVIRSDGQAASDADATLISRLGELKLPNLLVFGTKDLIAPAEAGRHYRSRIPACNLIFVYDAGHAMEIERPEAVAALVFDFLERHDQFLVRRDSDLIYP